MISQTTEYALRAVVFMAQHPNSPYVTQQVAEATKVPPGYLAKVLQSLSRAGLVSSQRGLGGGFTLAKSPSEMTIYAVVQAVEPIQRIRTCPLKISAHGTNLCALHQKLDDAMAIIEKSFQETTLADLLAEPRKSTPLCPFPRVLPKSMVRAQKSKPAKPDAKSSR